MADPLRHRQTKGAATDMVDLTPPRHIPTLPRADTPCWLARLTPLSVPYLVRGSERCRQARAENPGGIVGGCLVGIVSGEINHAAIIREGRGPDRPRRHQRLTRCGRTSDLSQLVASARISGQKPRAGVEPAVTDIDNAVAARDR